MEPYLIVSLSIILYSFFLSIGKNSSKILNILFYSLIIGAFSILFYLRSFSIGIDTYTYSEIMSDVLNFSNISEVFPYSIKNNLEPGFIFTIYLLGFLGGISFIFTFFSIVIYFNYCYVLSKIKINPVLYFLSFFSYFGVYLWSLNILRQMIAVSFVVLASYFLTQEKNRNFVFFILIASLFHYSAIFCILFYFLYRNINFLYRFRFLIFLLIIFFTKYILSNFVVFYDRYSTYSQADSKGGVGVFLLFFYIITVFVGDFFGRKYSVYYLENKFFNLILLLYLSLQFAFIFSGINNLGTSRFVIYFLWPSVFIWGIFFTNIKLKYHRLLLSLLFFVFLITYWFYSLSNLKLDFVPFVFK